MTETNSSITNPEIADAIRLATSEVFSTMLGVEMTAGETHVSRNGNSNFSGVVALLGLAGSWAGSGQLSCEPVFARMIASKLLGTEFPAVDEEVLDAMGEVANMVVGNVKTALERKLGEMGLGIPTVIYGRNMETHSVHNPEWVTVPFSCEGGTITVQLTLAPKRHFRPHQPA